MADDQNPINSALGPGDYIDTNKVSNKPEVSSIDSQIEATTPIKPSSDRPFYIYVLAVFVIIFMAIKIHSQGKQIQSLASSYNSQVLLINVNDLLKQASVEGLDPSDVQSAITQVTVTERSSGRLVLIFEDGDLLGEGVEILGLDAIEQLVKKESGKSQEVKDK